METMRTEVTEPVSEYKAIVPPKFFPHCIVWSPIPVVTWLIPFIGHLGVCSSDGTIYDFAGGVNVGHFAFGSATKFLQLEPVAASVLAPMPHLSSAWDRAIHYSEGIFNQRMYSFCGNNCHRFVAHFLEQVRFGNRQQWGQVHLGGLMFFYGHNVSTAAAIKTYAPFAILVALAMVFLRPLFTLYVWCATVVLLVGVLHACDLAIRSYEVYSGDADLAVHGPPPVCWSSVGPPDALVATPSWPSEFLVQRPKIQRRVFNATMQSLVPDVSPVR